VYVGAVRLWHTLSERKGAPVQLAPDLAGLAWIQYMRWARRADSVNASRKLLVKARKWPHCPWQVGNLPLG
jgi:hypothetical protein